MQRLTCIKTSFAQFQNIMDDICGMEDSYGYYWDIDSSGVFFRKNNPEFTLIDLADYFEVNRIQEIIYIEKLTGIIYIIAE